MLAADKRKDGCGATRYGNAKVIICPFFSFLFFKIIDPLFACDTQSIYKLVT
jgi:hypothetical protein